MILCIHVGYLLALRDPGEHVVVVQVADLAGGLTPMPMKNTRLSTTQKATALAESEKKKRSEELRAR